MSDDVDAWDFFMTHHDDIRDCVAMFLPERPQSMVGAFGGPSERTVEDFDKAVAAQDRLALHSIMEAAWVRAPEDRSVYRIPGFTPMCDLLDETVEGFVPEDQRR